jgi:hypothetical protein
MPVVPEVGVGYIFAVRSLAEQINNINSQSAITSLLSWAYGSLFQVNSATRDINSTIITANITWPDGVLGIFTTDVASTAFPGAIDAWHATYLSTPTKVVTQPTVSRDINGAVVIQPAIIIS